MTEKKVSFGFKQVKKQPLLLPNLIGENKGKNDGIELIQCLEGKTIKVFNEKEKEKPLVIPLLNSQKTSTALASLKNLQNVINGEDANGVEKAAVTTNTEVSNSKSLIEPQTIEQRVISELLAEAKDDGEGNGESKEGTLSVLLTDDKAPLDGAKESTVDDYDRIPIVQFGLAMLRGMGLKDEEIISKQNKEIELRPKGMGLGADKMIKKNKLLVEPASNEILEIKKNAYVRILAGKYKDLYGQIEGLDDHACRVIVKLALGGNKETLNEFMVQPVTKQEYTQYGKVINSAKYEEYKKKQNEDGVIVKSEIPTSSRVDSRDQNSYKNSDRKSSRERERLLDSKQNRDYSRERDDRASSSYNRRSRSKERRINRYKDISCVSSKYERNEVRHHQRSLDKDAKHKDIYSLSTRDEKHRQKKDISDSSSSASSSSSNSRHHRRSHHSKKHKKKSDRSKHRSDDEDDKRHFKKKTKKSKRERSRSRGRRTK